MKLIPRKFTRRDWLRSSPFLAAGGAFAYGTLYERLHFNVERVDCPLAKEHVHLNGFRIAFMTDFHYDDFGNEEMLRRAVKTINDESVDLILLGGDYVSNDATYLEPLAEILQDLKARLGTFGVMGNHDYHYERGKAQKTLGSKGIRFLINQVEEFDGFSLIGQDSAWEGIPAIKGNLNKAPVEKPILLCWHEPDTFDFYQDSRVVLQVSGHTHGGQVCAPLYGPLQLPRLGRKYVKGLFHDRESNLYVSRGIGTLNIPTRFLSPPEVSILTLVAS